MAFRRSLATATAPVLSYSGVIASRFRRSLATTTAPVLSYFNIVGRAEPLRLLLADGCHSAGERYEQTLFSKSEWDSVHKAQTPLGSTPTLRWGKDVEVAQTLAIAQFLGSTLDRQGSSDADLAACATLTACCYTELLSPLSNVLWAPVRLKGIPLRAVTHAYYAKVIDLLPRLEGLMAQAKAAKQTKKGSAGGSVGPFLLGNDPCVADFFLAEWARRHRSSFRCAQLDLPSVICELQESVMARPGVLEYVERWHPQMRRHSGGELDGELRWTNSPEEPAARKFLASYEHDASNADVYLGRGSF